jgi:lipopolysaccharide/colanic/teichoic acid biosynthesis glycosyltransferase
VSTRTMEYGLERSPDVERAAERLARPRARMALLAKRGVDVVLALAMLIALAPLALVVVLLLAFGGDGMVERRKRLGRHGQAVVLTRFCALPGGAFGRFLERIGARELPVLLTVLRGRLSFVGPRVVEPGTGAGHTGPRRLMAPGLIGPAQLACTEASESALDDAYVEQWSLWHDAQMLVGHCPAVHHQSVSKSSS